MDELISLTCAIGLLLSAIEAVAIGIYFRNSQFGFLTFAGAIVGAMIPIVVYLVQPAILYRMGLTLAGGKDVFNSSLLGTLIAMIGLVLLGSILGALAILIISFRFPLR